mgnify:CR=1 FL=1
MNILNTLSLKSNSQIKINFDGGDLSSDAGLLLIKKFVSKIGIDRLFSHSFKTNDSASFRYHTDKENLLQIIYMIIAGYFKDNASDELTQPNATQFLALCKILGITNIYDTFIGEYTPDNPFSELNEEGIQKAKEYIDLLIKSGDYTREDTSVLPSYLEIKLFDLPASAGT